MAWRRGEVPCLAGITVRSRSGTRGTGHVKSQREQIVPAKFKKAVAGHTQTPLLSAQGASQFVHQSDVEHAEQFGGQAVSHTPAVVVVVGKWNTPEHAVQYVALVEQPSQLVWQGSQTEMLR